MATLAELHTLFTDPALLDKVGAACVIVAENIRTEDPGTTNHANRVLWAKKIFEDVNGSRDDMLRAVIAANNTLTLAQITGASDAAIVTAVGNAVNVFAGA